MHLGINIFHHHIELQKQTSNMHAQSKSSNISACALLMRNASQHTTSEPVHESEMATTDKKGVGGDSGVGLLQATVSALAPAVEAPSKKNAEGAHDAQDEATNLSDKTSSGTSSGI